MTIFLKSGTKTSIAAESDLSVYNSLPGGTYIVKFNEQIGQYFLQEGPAFTTPSFKVYGDVKKRCDRVINTYQTRTSSTGVLMVGTKGSGKTMLIRLIALQASEQNIPILIINEPHHGDTFNKFIHDIDQEAIIIFDEFEKVYDMEDQKSLLTLLDGVYQQKKLFLLSANDQYRLDTNMINRPGRIFYRFDYIGLSDEFVMEYLEDNLINKDQIKSCIAGFNYIGSVNFDILAAIVEEMNRYNESFQDTLNVINVRPEKSDNTFDVTWKVKGKKQVTRVVQGNPLASQVSFWVEEIDDTVVIKPTNMISGDAQKGEYVFREAGIDFTFKRQDRYINFNYMDTLAF